MIASREIVAAALALMAVWPALGLAQPYPAKPVKIVVPGAAGGPTDVPARLVSDQLSALLGQRFVVENRAAAGGVVAGETVARSAPDGYTLLFANSSALAVNPALYAQMPYDTATAFAPIGFASNSPQAFLVHPSVPVTSIRELLAYAKANPGKLNYGTFGLAGVQHMTMVDLQKRWGVEMTSVPYKGGSDLYQGLLSKQIEVVADASGWIPLVQSGQFRLLVVWGSQRMKLFPEVRTLKETGIDLVVNSPYGVCGPKGMEPALVKKIHDAFKEGLFDPATQAVMEKFSMPTLYLDTEAYAAAAKEQHKIEHDNLVRVGMLAKQG